MARLMSVRHAIVHLRSCVLHAGMRSLLTRLTNIVGVHPYVSDSRSGGPDGVDSLKRRSCETEKRRPRSELSWRPFDKGFRLLQRNSTVPYELALSIGLRRERDLMISSSGPNGSFDKKNTCTYDLISEIDPARVSVAGSLTPTNPSLTFVKTRSRGG